LLGAAALVFAGNVVSRLLGLVRDPVMAQFFGRNSHTDAFVGAQSLSTVVYDFLVSGLVSAALIPTLSRLASKEDRSEFWRVGNAVMTLGVIVLAAVVGVLMLLAPQLVQVMSGGYDSATLVLETQLARLMIPTVFLMGMSAVAMSILYSLHRYRLPALAIACVNAGVIGGMLLLHRLGIVSAAAGLLAGAAAQLALEIVALARARMPFRPRFEWRHPEVRRIGQLYLPVAASVVITGAVTVLERHLYSLNGAGSLSASNYATRLLQVPLGLVSTAISMAILPTISRYADGADWPAYRRIVGAGLKVSVLLTLPVLVGLTILAGPAIDLLFRHGAFTPSDAAATTLAFRLYAPQLPFVAVDQLLIYAFYARHDTRTPTAVAFVTAVIWAIAAFVGLQLTDWRALVLANSIQNCAHAVILFTLLWRKEPAMAHEGLGSSFGRGCVAALVMAVACLAVAGAMTRALGSGKAVDLLLLLVAGGGSGLVYLGLLLLWNGDEANLVRRTLRRQVA